MSGVESLNVLANTEALNSALINGIYFSLLSCLLFQYRYQTML
jgi:hypothetical protein